MAPTCKFILLPALMVVAIILSSASSSETPESAAGRNSRQFLFPYSASGPSAERYYPQQFGQYLYPMPIASPIAARIPYFDEQPADFESDPAAAGYSKANQRLFFGLANQLFSNLRPSATSLCPKCPPPTTCPSPTEGLPATSAFTTCPTNTGITTASQGTITLTNLANPATCVFSIVAFPARQYRVSCSSGTLGATGRVAVSHLPDFTPTTITTDGTAVTTVSSAATVITVTNAVANGAATCSWQAV